MNDLADVVLRAMDKVVNAPPRLADPVPVHPDTWERWKTAYSDGEGDDFFRSWMRMALGEDEPSRHPSLIVPRGWSKTDPPRSPETDLGVLVSASLALGYFAEYDRRMVREFAPPGEVLGFLNAPTDATVIRTPEEAEYWHVFDHLAPLVRREASNPEPLPPSPPRPPPYPCGVGVFRHNIHSG